MATLAQIQTQSQSTEQRRGIYVVCYLHKPEFIKYLKFCLQSIFRYHGTEYPIIIIDNHSPVPVTLELIETTLESSTFTEQITIWRNDQYPRGAFMMPYWYNWQYRPFDKFLVFHDSMTLSKPIPLGSWNQSDWQMLWYFDHGVRTYRLHKSMLETWSDKVNQLSESKLGSELMTLYRDAAQACHQGCQCWDCRTCYQNQHLKQGSDRWTGCFGGCLMITADLTDRLFRECYLGEYLKMVTSKADIELFERLLPVMLFYLTGATGHQNQRNLCGDINDHPWCQKTPDCKNLDHLLVHYQTYHSFVIKTWKNRL